MKKTSRLAQRKNPKPKKKLPTKFLLFCLVVVCLVAVAFTFRKPVWEKDTQLIMAITQDDGSVRVLVLDPAVENLTQVLVPGDTQVEVAQNLGVWRLKSVTKLGKSEGYGDQLVAQTITKSLKFPTYAWAASSAVGFVDEGVSSKLKATLMPYETNLTMRDRFKIITFVLSLKTTDKTEIDLSQSSYLSKTKLTDGQEGYIIRENAPTRLMSIFSDNLITKESLTVSIINSSNSAEPAQNLGKIIEVLGAKVVALNPSPTKDFNCLIRGEKNPTLERIIKLYGCQHDRKTIPESFDIEIEIGEQFAKQY